MKIEIETIKTSEIDDSLLKQINMLKNQHWKHTETDHIEWFKENIRDDDIHLMIYRNDSIAAYLNMVIVKILVDGKVYQALGIGNVCVSKEEEHTGLGSVLMASANAVIKNNEKCGVLLCHDNLVGFYEKSGWKKIMFDKVIVEGETVNHNIMFYDPYKYLPNGMSVVELDRNF